MKSFDTYIIEKIKDLPDSIKGLIVFDIKYVKKDKDIYILSIL